LTQIDELQLVKRLRWTAIVLVAFGAALTLAAQPSRFWSLPKTAIRFDGLPIHSSTNPMFDFFLGHGWLAYLAGVGLYAHFTITIQPPRQICSSGATPVGQGSLCIPACTVGRLSSPQAASNPHTSTALAA